MFCKDLWMIILSKLPVKSLLRFSCVSKYFQSLICDSSFVKLHLQNSPKGTNFLLSYSNHDSFYVFPSHINSCFEDPLPFFFDDDDMSESQKNKYQVIGSCNGLVCLRKLDGKWDANGSNMFHLWNPATRKLFENLHCKLNLLPLNQKVVMLGFGYDNSRDIYKLVVIVSHSNSEEYPFRSLICNMEDKSGWRDIQTFPADPTTTIGHGIYLENTLNWVGLLHSEHVDLRFNDMIIVSLNLKTETYTQLLLPGDLSEVKIYDLLFSDQEIDRSEAPLIGILGGCLSLFLHNGRTNHLSIWQMKEFGNQNSWSPLLITSLRDLGIDGTIYAALLPLCMIENDRDIIIIYDIYHHGVQRVIYNQTDKTVKSTLICEDIWWIYHFDYVESLVSPVNVESLVSPERLELIEELS